MIQMLEQAINTINKLLESKQDIKVRIALIKNRNKIVEATKLLQDTCNSVLLTYGTVEEDGKVKFETKEKELECMGELNKIKLPDLNENITIFNTEELLGLDTLENAELESIIFMIN